MEIQIPHKLIKPIRKISVKRDRVNLIRIIKSAKQIATQRTLEKESLRMHIYYPKLNWTLK